MTDLLGTCWSACEHLVGGVVRPILRHLGEDPDLERCTDLPEPLAYCVKCFKSQDRSDELPALYDGYHLGEAVAACNIVAPTVTGIFTSPNGDTVTLIYVVPDGQGGTTAVSSPVVSTTDVTQTDVSQAKTVIKSPKPTETPQTDNEADGPDGPNDPNGDSSRLSRGALAGALVAPILFVLIIVIVGAVWWRKRRRSAVETKVGIPEPVEKPMLHSDCLPKPVPSELHDDGPAQELEGDAPKVAEVDGTGDRVE